MRSALISRINIYSIIIMFSFQSSLGSFQNTNTQARLRPMGFGGHFADAPPPFIREEPEDNKIERKKKPTCPKGHKVCKCKKNKKKKTKSK